MTDSLSAFNCDQNPHAALGGKEISIQTSNGDIVCSLYGDPSFKHPVFYFHGFPTCRLEPALCDKQAFDEGITLIAPDRPGMGRSQFKPNRKLIEWPVTVSQIAEYFALDQFAICGLSGGTPYALVSAYALKSRVRSVLIISGIAAMGKERSYKGMHWVCKAAFGGYINSRILSKILLTAVAGVCRFVPRLFTIFMGLMLKGDDRRILSLRKYAAHMTRCYYEGRKGGMRGLLCDFGILSAPWGFPLSEISAPTIFIHGDDDGLLPLSMAAYNSGEVPDSQLRVLNGKGHFFALEESALIIRTLRDQFRL